MRVAQAVVAVRGVRVVAVEWKRSKHDIYVIVISAFAGMTEEKRSGTSDR